MLLAQRALTLHEGLLAPQELLLLLPHRREARGELLPGLRGLG